MPGGVTIGAAISVRGNCRRLLRMANFVMLANNSGSEGGFRSPVGMYSTPLTSPDLRTGIVVFSECQSSGGGTRIQARAAKMTTSSARVSATLIAAHATATSAAGISTSHTGPGRST